MPKQSKVTLGGREYVVSEKYSGITELWRKRLRESSVYTTFQSLDDVIALVFQIADEGFGNLDGARVGILARILPAIVDSLANSMDEIKALVFDYSPEIAKDKEWLGEHAYDSEYTDVFVEVLKLNFPILGVLELLRGFKAPGTSTNLPSTNGATGTNKRTARSKTR